MQPIINKAIEGGWSEHFGDRKIRMVFSDKTGWWYEWDTEDEDGNIITLQNPCCYDHIKYQYPLILNSNFWQALGEACGWDTHNPKCLMVALDSKTNCQCKAKAKTQQEWKRYALSFHEINLTHGWDKAVEYLEELIK